MPPLITMWMKALKSVVLATLSVAAFTALIAQFEHSMIVANVALLYLLVVIFNALFLGRLAAVWASFTSFLAFNWFFVNPRYTFSVKEPNEWVTLCMFLLIATVTGQLMALLKAREADARRHHSETTALAEASWAVASRFDTRSALGEVLKQVARVVNIELAAVVSLAECAPYVVASYPEGASNLDPNSMKSDDVNQVVLPIAMNDRQFGFVYVKLPSGQSFSPGQRQIIDSLVSYTAVIFQRHEFMKSETKAQALADADRLKTALLSMVSHDFRSPLTSIKANISTLMSEGSPLDSETQRSLCQAIDQETDRLNSMVGNILDLSRLESDAWRPKLEPISTSELIGMVLDLFSAENNRRIVVEIDPDLIEVKVDCVQMVQVLKNLIENALKYSDSEQLVEIDCRSEDGQVIIEIADRGGGFDPENAEHLFEPFYRAPEFKETSVPGIGIGLAVCRGLVEAHEGKLIAKNRDGGGSVFQIALQNKYKNSGGVVVETGTVG